MTHKTATATLAKMAGWANLKEMADYYGVTTQALRNWNKARKNMFKALLKK